MSNARPICGNADRTSSHRAFAGAGRRPVPPCGRSRARPGGARPPASASSPMRHRRRRAPRRRSPRSRPSSRSASRRVPMSRHIGVSDVAPRCVASARALREPRPTCCTVTAPRAAPMRGSRPAAARSASTRRMAAACTTAAARRVGIVYLALERVLMRAHRAVPVRERVSRRDAFHAKVGTPRSLVRVVHNGVTAAEFASVAAHADATDLVFVGELRVLKGVDVLIEAIGACLQRDGRRVSATIVGDGAGRRRLQGAGANGSVFAAMRFPGAMPARAGFARGRLPGGAVARGIPALYRARSRRGRRAADRDQRRRHPGNLRPAGRSPGAAGRRRGAGATPSRPRSPTGRRAGPRRSRCASGCGRNSPPTPWTERVLAAYWQAGVRAAVNGSN